MNAVISRFAPSPTGRLHLGHAWSAVQAYDAARTRGGRFYLRIEDIDITRCRAEFIDAIFEDMAWLGLDYDGDVLIQSQRLPQYRAALARLEAMRLTYRCTCTRSQLGDAPYPGTCRLLGRGEGAWRIDMARAVAAVGSLTWHEQGVGSVAADPLAAGDVIIARKDIGTSYHLAVTVDDAAQGVTHIVRGHDLYGATPIHRLLQTLLDLPEPQYHHHPLIVGTDGARLAKRKGSPTLAALRGAGMSGGALSEMMRAGRFPVGFALAAD